MNMKAYSSLLRCALVLAAAVLAQAAHAQNYCFTVDGQSLAVAFDVHADTDILSGVTTNGLFLASGARGTTGQTIHHLDLALMNPDADDDPGCTDAPVYGTVDWLNYNGHVTGGNLTTGYIWSGHGFNACTGYLGARTGTITPGDCPPSFSGAPAGGDLVFPTAAAGADNDAAGLDADDSSLLAAVPEGGRRYCYTDTFGLVHEGTLDAVSNVLSGFGDNGDGLDWYVQGGRGTGTTIRHLTFTWQNPGAGNGSGCDDGAGAVDWFTFNGLVSGSGPYSYDSVWLDSCGSVGTRSGTITVGSCPAPR